MGLGLFSRKPSERMLKRVNHFKESADKELEEASAEYRKNLYVWMGRAEYNVRLLIWFVLTVCMFVISFKFFM